MDEKFYGGFIFKGNKSQLKNANVKKLQAMHQQHGTFVFNKKDASFIRNQLDKFKRDLIKVLILFDFGITDQNNLKFEILGFDHHQVERIKNGLVENFLKKAASTIIQLNANDDLVKMQELVKEFKGSIESDDAGSESSDKGDLFNFDVDVQIILNQQKRIIFLNGNSAEELDEIRNNLLEKINGSKKCTQSVKYKNLVLIIRLSHIFEKAAQLYIVRCV